MHCVVAVRRAILLPPQRPMAGATGLIRRVGGNICYENNFAGHARGDVAHNTKER